MSTGTIGAPRGWISNLPPMLAMAVLLVLLFSCTQEPVETTLLLPLGFSSLPVDLVKIPSHITNLEIRIKGPAGLIKKAGREDISYLVDLFTDLAPDPARMASTIKPGFYTIPILEERIPLNPKITILKITPTFVTVQLEKKMVKRLPVHVPYTGEAAPGFTALDAATDPGVIEVTGPQSTLSPMRFIMTKPVDITNAKEDFKKNLPLDLSPSASVAPSTAIVVADIPIVETITTQDFKDLTVATINSSSPASVVPPTMEIKVKGPVNTLKKDGIKEAFKIYIDLEGLAPGVYVRRAAITLPVGLILADTKPELFTVTIN